MKKITKILAAVCLTAMLLSACMLSFTGCVGGNDVSDTSESGNTSTVIVDGKTDYTVSVKSIGGLAIPKITIFIYADEALEDLVGYGITDDNGIAVINLPVANGYRIVLSDPPEGYITEVSYGFTGTSAAIVLNSQIIDDPDLSGVTYGLGSVMHDFTVTDADGNSYTLSEILKEKDMVMLNFWYTTCSYCVAEFPYMDEAYNQYKDNIEIIAMNHYTSDSEDEVAEFKSNYNLSFPMVKEDLGMQNAFNLQGYPTSVFIDRYGVICLIEVGGVTSATPFNTAFELFTADDYTQKFYEGLASITPIQKPDVEAPAVEDIANVLSAGNANISYSHETDPEEAELTWPFVIGKKDGVDCVYPSNAGVNNSYATIYLNVSLKKGEAVGFDYYSSTDSYMDIMYVLVDRQDIYQISGESDKWNSCYPFVALEDGEYEVALCYYKDSADGAGDDTVYVKNVRTLSADKIDVPSYIPRYCATNLKENGLGYENYVDIVFNEKDGYYHVGTKDGPLLLANLMTSTRFSNDSINDLGYNGHITIDGENVYEALLPYCTMASNSEIYGMCTVNEELKQLLIKTAKAIGVEQTDNEWLQICSYYDVYGNNGVQLADPVRGLSTENAFIAKLGKDNVVTYNRVIMPRGLFYKFVPTVSGAYRITSNCDQLVNAWVFLADKTEYFVYEHSERLYNDPNNCSMVVYMEAGKEYFIDIAYYDVYATGTFTFEIKYEAASMQLFRLASPGYFTFYEDDSNATVSGGIDIALGNDGYYHELLPDGSLGSILYADFIGQNNIFSTTLKQMANNSQSFNFELTEDDQWLLDYIEENGDDFIEDLKEYWGENFDYYMEELDVEDVAEGDYNGDGEDMTAIAKKYAAMAYGPNSATPELEGCVPVNKELGEVLQALMDKFTFKDVEYSWAKLCYYYDYIGPDANK